jgi:hypothetical protein
VLIEKFNVSAWTGFFKKTHALFHKEYLANLERIEERIGLN